jgi:hypothetical protein
MDWMIGFIDTFIYNHNISQSMTAYDSLHSLLDYDRVLSSLPSTICYEEDDVVGTDIQVPDPQKKK